MFVRYRQWSSANVGKWHYDEYPDGYSVSEIKEELRNTEYNWASPWHKTEVEVIEVPPVDWFIEEIRTSEEIIKHNKKRIERYRKLIQQ